MRLESYSVTTAEGLRRHLTLLEDVYAKHLPVPAPVEKTKAELQRSDLSDWQFVQVFSGSELNTSLAVGPPAGTSNVLSEEIGFVGYFVSRNHEKAAQHALNKGVELLANQGKSTVLGPINGDTWHRYRFTLGPVPEQPFFLEPMNPEYYPSLWTKAGFTEDETYHSKKTSSISALCERFQASLEQVTKRGIELRPFDTDHFEEELSRLHRLSLRIFENNYMYTPISEPAFVQLYRAVKPLIVETLTCFAMNEDGEEIGFAFAIPDYKPDPELNDLSSSPEDLPDTINVKTVGVVPGYRNKNVGKTMMAYLYQTIDSLGANRVNLCLMQDGNYSSRFDAGTGEQFRRYALYRKCI